MWKGKRKFIIVGLLVVAVAAGSIAGVAFAQTGSAATSGNTTLLDRVAVILKIDPQTLKNAFTQAQQEQRDAALDNYLKKQVAENRITQKQADDYKAWLKSKPNVPLPGGGQPFGMHRFPGGRGGMMGGGGPYFRGAPAPVTPGTTS